MMFHGTYTSEFYRGPSETCSMTKCPCKRGNDGGGALDPGVDKADARNAAAWSNAGTS